MKKIFTLITLVMTLHVFAQSDIDVSNWVYNEDDNITEYKIPDGVKVIKKNEFSFDWRYQSILIPNSVKKIKKGAFMSSGLKTIKIPNSIKTIKSDAFKGSHLETVIIPNSVKKIKRTTFFACPELKTVVIPRSVKKIGKLAFSCCEHLETVTIEEGVTKIGYSSFDNTNIMSITIPGSVKKIKTFAFSKCEKLASVNIQPGTKVIGSYAFDQCIELYSVQIPHSVKKVSETAFWYCIRLKTANTNIYLKTLNEAISRRDTTQYLEICRVLMGCYFHREQYDSLQYYAQKIMDLHNIQRYYDENYSTDCSFIASYYSQIGDYHRAKLYSGLAYNETFGYLVKTSQNNYNDSNLIDERLRRQASLSILEYADACINTNDYKKAEELLNIYQNYRNVQMVKIINDSVSFIFNNNREFTEEETLLYSLNNDVEAGWYYYYLLLKKTYQLNDQISFLRHLLVFFEPEIENYGHYVIKVYNYIIKSCNMLLKIDYDIIKLIKGAIVGLTTKEANDIISSIGDVFYFYNVYDSAYAYYSSAFTYELARLKSSFSFMNTYQRHLYWDEHQTSFNNIIKLSTRIPYNYDALKMAYNSLLISKGLLLASERSISIDIFNSKDEKLINDFCKLQKYRVVIDTMKNVDSRQTLQENINWLETSLMNRISRLTDAVKYMRIECQDVQKHLSPSDVAIEFFIESDTIYALILKKDFDAPKLIQLSKAAFDEPYSNTAMYKGIWQPLEKYFSTEGNIYFSPSGILHTLAIEHAPINNEEIISDRYKHLYRVSSTRNIALSVAHNTDNTAAIFGGIEYYAEKDTIVKYFADIYRGGNMEDWKELKNTGAEAMSIDTILKQKGFRTEMLTKSAASEENFKRLSGGNYRIMHIATHGYFHADSTAYDNLTNSALVFAGVNITKPEDDIDDGLLTAREISRMDLRNTDLVVLSACQTALGIITSEGVFGIQRGFKKAGVNTIVMSVKKVYDVATKEFMVEFYKNMVGNGLSKHEAFISAVHTMRKKYPDDPDKWAMFIMLDGIE